MAMTERSCRHVRDLLVDYDDGALTLRQAGQVEQHLSACAACNAELKALRRSLELARGVWEAAAADVQRFDSSVPRRSRRSVPRCVAGAVACLAVTTSVVLWAWMASTGRNSDTGPGRNGAGSVADAVRIIEREAAAAKLAASAEILANHLSARAFTNDSLRYLAAAYADTGPGKEAAAKIPSK